MKDAGSPLHKACVSGMGEARRPPGRARGLSPPQRRAPHRAAGAQQGLQRAEGLLGVRRGRGVRAAGARLMGAAWPIEGGRGF